MPFDLVLLPLLGGYWFVSLCHLFRLSVSKHAGERLVFAAATAGIVLAAAAWTIVSILVANFPTLQINWHAFIPWQYSGTAFGAFLLGPASALIVNLFISVSAAEEKAINAHGTGLERLFWEATEPSHPQLVQLTLDDAKVYVGWIQRTSPNPRSPDGFVRLLPVRSGFRNSERRVEYTTLYENIYLQMLDDDQITAVEAEFLNSFLKVIPLSRIVSAGIFSPSAHKLFAQQGKPQEN